MSSADRRHARTLKEHLRKDDVNLSRHAPLIYEAHLQNGLDAEIRRWRAEEKARSELYVQIDADLSRLHADYQSGSSVTALARRYANEWFSERQVADRITRCFRRAGLELRARKTPEYLTYKGDTQALSDKACVDLVVKHGYKQAAALLDVPVSRVVSRIKALGATDEVQRRRGRVSGALTTWAAERLGVSGKTVGKMRRDGRLSSAFTKDEVEALVASWALVPSDGTRYCRCEVCSQAFRIKPSWAVRRNKTCSKKCRDELRARNRVTKPKPHRTVSVRLSKRPIARDFMVDSCGVCEEVGIHVPGRSLQDVECCECGTKFSPVLTKRKVYCSKLCMNRGGRRLRKARERGAVKTERVFRKRVFKRDKWRCQICGDKVDRSVRPDHPLAPTIDHIHPLSLGGTHTYDNVRTAHYGCNSSRGNRDQFQMRMPVAA